MDFLFSSLVSRFLCISDAESFASLITMLTLLSVSDLLQLDLCSPANALRLLCLSTHSNGIRRRETKQEIHTCVIKMKTVSWKIISVRAFCSASRCTPHRLLSTSSNLSTILRKQERRRRSLIDCLAMT